MTEDDLDTDKCLPNMEELDTTPSTDEMSKSIDTLTTGKAPGQDGIPS